jgi:hypothetical protein
MNESHWNPYFSPIVGHWKLLVRNAGEHIAGRAPRVTLQGAGGRIGLNSQQAQRLTHGFDVWPAYAIYSGMKPTVVLGCWSFLLIIGFGYLFLVWRESGFHRPRPEPQSFRPDSRQERHYQPREQDPEEKEFTYLRDE